MRRLSLLVAGAYLMLAGLDGPETFFHVMLFLLLPLGAVWFPEEMGAFTGGTWGGLVTATTPAALVSLVGWTLLLLPVGVGLLGLLLG